MYNIIYLCDYPFWVLSFQEKGYQNVRFHVVAKLRHFTAEDATKIRKTVAEILNCPLDEVTVNGYLHSTSFFIVLSIKDIYIEQLLTMKQHEKNKLKKLNIDYFKDDFHTVILVGTAGNILLILK